MSSQVNLFLILKKNGKHPSMLSFVKKEAKGTPSSLSKRKLSAYLNQMLSFLCLGPIC